MKKKVIVSALIIISAVAVGKILITPENQLTASAQQQVTPSQQVTPAYAKWGKLAMEKVKEKYPDSDIIDYLHLGREAGNDTSVEKFKLWLKTKDNREFGVFVDIKFNNQSEEIVEINYSESDI